ncbi:MAG: AIR synthase related protein [Acidilobaceae archaeon]|nr:AIR synthase related protein [Acidilobaceae archaeon]MCX8166112.1 AIR synthase related protein [Acidilobaceae archaeon]MDW7974755.1 AIR synthase related protein [Sulfolobales archaeon]
MSFEEWLGLLKRLAELSGSLHVLDIDASPFDGLLLNIDGYSAQDSRLPWMSWSDWGWKATVAALSDIAASGGKPAAIAYSVGAPSIQVMEEVARGVGEAARWAQVSVLKSDTNRARGDSWIDVAALGFTLRPVGRGNARPGDLLIQVGLLGYGLVATLAFEGKLEVAEFPESLEYSRRPRPPLEIGHKLAECGAAAAIDNSDGWAASLYQLSLASEVRVGLESYLAANEALEALGRVGASEELLLQSWEDYTLAVAAGREAAECILAHCKKRRIPCAVVGELREGRGVEFKGKEVPPLGWSPLPP